MDAASHDPVADVASARGWPGAILEIDLDAIAANWRQLCRLHPAGTVGAVLKADAYGLGAAPVAVRLFREGCRRFFTATLDEALAIRPLVGDAFIAALNGAIPGSEAEFVRHAIVPALGSLAEVAAWRGCDAPAVLHLDTGMNRLGLSAAEQDRLPLWLEGVRLSHVMSHLVSSELADDETNEQQRRRFAAACARLPPLPRSLANSSGIFLGPGFALDLARPGAALYGLNPTPGRPNPMRPVVRLRARVLQLRAVGAGETVGYNATWRATRPSRIAIAAAGYADGWPRALSSRGAASFDGRTVPLVGRVSMDLSTYDVTELPLLAPGDWLELLGPSRSPDQVAAEAGTNGYEILTALGARYHRLYHGA